MSFVLVGEGPRWASRKLWSTHRVLGVFETRQEAVDHVPTLDPDEEDVLVLTNLDDLEDRERIEV